jgi:streptomycin 6-kinase
VGDDGPVLNLGRLATTFGDRGPTWASWADSLPALASDLLGDWNLTPDGDPTSGATAVVLPVRDETGTRGVLKLSFVEPDNAGEIEALKAWRGQGAVRLERADPHRGALLLERLGPADLTTRDPLDACDIVGRLYRRLHLPAGPRLPDLNSFVNRWLDDLAALGRDVPAPPRFVQQALSTGRALASDRATRAIVHGDLHYGNVLAGRREPWLVIDPKGFNGDPCYELAPMLWNRWGQLATSGDVGAALRERFYALTDASGLDERRCRDWVVVRSMIGVAWEVADARAAGHPLTTARRDWITRLVTTAKAMQAVGQAG